MGSSKRQLSHNFRRYPGIQLQAKWTHKKLHQSNHRADQDSNAVPAGYICITSPLATTCSMCTPVGAVYFYSLNGQEVHRCRRLHGTSHHHSPYTNLLCKIWIHEELSWKWNCPLHRCI